MTFCWGVPESAACTVKLKVPAAVGVPVIAPAELRVKPAGSGFEPVARLQVIGVTPPVDARVVE